MNNDPSRTPDQHKGDWLPADYNDGGRVVFIRNDDNSTSDDKDKPIQDRCQDDDREELGEGLIF